MNFAGGYMQPHSARSTPLSSKYSIVKYIQGYVRVVSDTSSTDVFVLLGLHIQTYKGNAWEKD